MALQRSLEKNKTEDDNSRQDVYIQRAEQIRTNTANRMGYPVMGPVRGRFGLFGFERDRQANEWLVDNRQLGIVPESPAGTLMINIGGQLQINHHTGATPPRSGAWQAEIDILHMLARHFNYSKELIRGYVTTGGTEANLACLWWCREYLANMTRLQKLQGSTRPILYTSDQAHYSIHKIANIINVDLRLVIAEDNGRINLKQLRGLLEAHMEIEPYRPVMMCATAGTTQLGAIDDLPAIKALLDDVVSKNKGLYTIHLDSALLGVTLPITKPYGEISSLFDFTDTMTISGHKFIGTTSICGMALTRRDIVECGYRDKDIAVSYVNNIQDTTISGTRSGFMVMELHNALCSLGLNKDAIELKKLIRTCLDNTEYLRDQLRELLGNDHVTHHPHQFVVTFPAPADTKASDDLEDKYCLMTVHGKRFGICVLATVDKSLIDEFLSDYRAILNRAHQSLNM